MYLQPMEPRTQAFHVTRPGYNLSCLRKAKTTTLLIMGRYYSTTMCYYWDMSVK